MPFDLLLKVAANAGVVIGCDLVVAVIADGFHTILGDLDCVVLTDVERGVMPETSWQVMENGQVLDAGRGLPAIEQIRKLIGAQRIEVVSEHGEVDGLTFDAQSLDPLISQARSTCRW